MLDEQDHAGLGVLTLTVGKTITQGLDAISHHAIGVNSWNRRHLLRICRSLVYIPIWYTQKCKYIHKDEVMGPGAWLQWLACSLLTTMTEVLHAISKCRRVILLLRKNLSMGLRVVCFRRINEIALITDS